jgi:hypothetical protein
VVRLLLRRERLRTAAIGQCVPLGLIAQKDTPAMPSSYLVLPAERSQAPATVARVTLV